jgi:hypothetical protein
VSHATLEPDPLPVDQRRLPRTDVMLAACSHERHAAFDLRKKPNSFSPCNLDYRRDSYNSEFALIALRLLRCSSICDGTLAARRQQGRDCDEREEVSAPTRRQRVR